MFSRNAMQLDTPVQLPQPMSIIASLPSQAGPAPPVAVTPSRQKHWVGIMLDAAIVGNNDGKAEADRDGAAVDTGLGLGAEESASDGLIEGVDEVATLGSPEGAFDTGAPVGAFEGLAVGSSLALTVGAALGAVDGFLDGELEDKIVGDTVGGGVGGGDGEEDGDEDGFADGEVLGTSVGIGVSMELSTPVSFTSEKGYGNSNEITKLDSL